MRKPPVGIKPKFVWKEERRCELKAAIRRYLEAGCRVPPEWVEEYNELLKGAESNETILF